MSDATEIADRLELCERRWPKSSRHFYRNERACIMDAERELRALAASLEKAQHALAIERGKLEAADALVESLQNRWASRPLSVEDTAALEKENDRLAARVAELERRMREAYKLAPAAFYPGDRQRVLDLLRPDSPDADGAERGR